MLDEEEWRDVVDYEGLYSVSNCGRVRSEGRGERKAQDGGHSSEGRVLKQAVTAGRCQVSLRKKNEKKETALVHRLVWEAFRRKCQRGEVVFHKDGDSLNNHLSNLECGTMKDTQKRFAATGRHCKGDAHPHAKLTSGEIPTIIARHRAGDSQGAIARDLGVSRSTIGKVVHGKTWVKHSLTPVSASGDR